MKKPLSLLMALLLLLTAASALAEPLKLGVVTPDADHGFTGESIRHAHAELASQQDLLGAEAFAYAYTVSDTVQGQADALEALLQWGADAILLWPVDGEPLREAAQAVLDAGTDLILYDRLIDGFEGLRAETMGDNEAIGGMMGDYILRYFEGRLADGEALSYLLFVGDASTVTDQRGGGMLAQFEASPYGELLTPAADAFVTDWSSEKAAQLLADWLAEAPAQTIAEIDFIVTHDDEIVDGLLTALSGAQMEGLRLITGVGGRRETLDALQSATLELDWVTYFFSPSFIRNAVRLAVADLMDVPYQGLPIKGQRFLIPTFEIDAASVDEFRQSDAYVERYALADEED